MDFPSKVGRLVVKGASTALDPLLGAFPGPRLLIYHRVNPDGRDELDVPVETFRAQLDWLASRGSVVALPTALAERGSPQAGRRFVLTFDDGYSDVHRHAFPLLAERKLPFTLYLTTGPLETGRPLAPGTRDPLTWKQVEEMASTGLVTLGAHTHRHVDLRSMPADRVAEELDRSNHLISVRTGLTARHFAYPWGYWSPTADAEVRARYESAVLGSGGPITERSDLYLLNRFPVQRSDRLTFFKARIRGGLRLEDRLRRAVHRYRGP